MMWEGLASPIIKTVEQQRNGQRMNQQTNDWNWSSGTNHVQKGWWHMIKPTSQIVKKRSQQLVTHLEENKIGPLCYTIYKNKFK